MTDFLKEIIKQTGNEYAALASDGIAAGDVTNFIDTGSYSFNALLSGSIYGGLPGNRITAIAGEAATGKTFFAMGILKNYLDEDKKAGVVLFESVMLPGPIHPGARESIWSIELSNSIFKCVPEKD